MKSIDTKIQQRRGEKTYRARLHTIIHNATGFVQRCDRLLGLDCLSDKFPTLRTHEFN